MILAHQSLTGHLPVTVLVVGGFAVYLRLWTRRPTPGRRPPLWAAAGCLAVLAASLPVLEAAADRSFAWHMVQHLLLWTVAPPLLVASRPGRIAAGTGGLAARAGHRLLPLRPGRTARPLASWLVVVIVMYATHLTPLYDLALRHQWIHEAEHAAYLGASLLLWSTVLAPTNRAPMTGAALTAATLAPLTLLGMILSSADTTLYPTYAAQLGPIDGLADQRLGATLMWLGTMSGLVPLLIVSVLRQAQREQRNAERRERLLIDVPLGGPIGPGRPDDPGAGRR